MSFNARDLPALDPRATTLARLVIAQERAPTAARSRRMVKLAQTLLSAEETLANAWIDSDDTGISSETIWSVMTGRKFFPGRLGWRGATPSDADDFGRCYRLIEKIPMWRKRLPEVAKVYPRWATIVREWDRLSGLHEAAVRALRTHHAPLRGREFPFPEEIALSAALHDLNIESGALIDPHRRRKAAL